MNSVNLTGRLTKDPELKQKTTGDGSYTFFCIAVDGGKDKSGEKLTDFIDCIAYNQQANFLSTYAKKGDLVEISGKIHTSSREDEQGNKTKRVTIVAFNVAIISSKNKETAKTEEPAKNETPAKVEETAKPETDVNTAPPDILPFEV